MGMIVNCQNCPFDGQDCVYCRTCHNELIMIQQEEKEARRDPFWD